MMCLRQQHPSARYSALLSKAWRDFTEARPSLACIRPPSELHPQSHFTKQHLSGGYCNDAAHGIWPPTPEVLFERMSRMVPECCEVSSLELLQGSFISSTPFSTCSKLRAHVIAANRSKRGMLYRPRQVPPCCAVSLKVTSTCSKSPD